MERLIDGDKLKKRICFKCNDKYSEEPCEPLDCVFCNAINDAPTVDAVGVVRCQDCKHCDDTSIPEYKHCFLNDRTVQSDDFCSFGERKEGNGHGG